MSDAAVYRGELMPQTLSDKMTLAQTLVKSGLMPPSLKTAEQVYVSLQWGHELGLSPMVSINNISVINGRPTLSVDIMHALVRSNPEYAGCKWEKMDNQAAKVIITRKFMNTAEEFIGYFDMKMAFDAGLTSKDNWKKYPARMLKHRALGYGLRDAFPDVLAGIYTPEEMTFAESNIIDVTPAPQAPNPKAEIKAPQEETASAKDLPDPKEARITGLKREFNAILHSKSGTQSIFEESEINEAIEKAKTANSLTQDEQLEALQLLIGDYTAEVKGREQAIDELAAQAVD